MLSHKLGQTSVYLSVFLNWSRDTDRNTSTDRDRDTNMTY